MPLGVITPAAPPARLQELLAEVAAGTLDLAFVRDGKAVGVAIPPQHYELLDPALVVVDEITPGFVMLAPASYEQIKPGLDDLRTILTGEEWGDEDYTSLAEWVDWMLSLDAAVEEYHRDPSTARSWEEFEQELIADGLLEPDWRDEGDSGAE